MRNKKILHVCVDAHKREDGYISTDVNHLILEEFGLNQSAL